MSLIKVLPIFPVIQQTYFKPYMTWGEVRGLQKLRPSLSHTYLSQPVRASRYLNAGRTSSAKACNASQSKGARKAMFTP